MLCFNHPIQRHLFGVCFLVRQNDTLTRPCRQTGVNIICQHTLCRCRISVARPDNFMAFRNGLGTKGNRRNCLNAANLINLIDTDDLCGSQNSVIHLALFVRRCDNHNLFHAGNLGRDSQHQQNGRKAALTARHIKANVHNRRRLFANHQTLVHLGKPHFLRQLLFMKVMNIFCRIGDGLSGFFVQTMVACLDLLRANLHLILPQRDTVKLFGVRKHCFVTTHSDIVRNFFGKLHMPRNINLCTL